jgi:hypothetical protein
MIGHEVKRSPASRGGVAMMLWAKSIIDVVLRL